MLASEYGKALIVSVEALDCRQWNSPRSKGNDWEKSDFHKWLNGEFKSEALPGYDGEVTLLSVEEAEEYFASDADRICHPTQTAIDNGAWTNRSGACARWLCPASAGGDNAPYVDGDGSFHGDSVDCVDLAVRPALWIDL